ncbi:MAG: NAD(P)-dependent oxidoreductase [Candidatus Micrarchaeales archaeon]|jgi:nucleoside-diphosphate-sugar epimerase
MKTNTGNETVLVTGATGRLGRRLVNRFIDRGDTVRALVIGKDEINSLTPGVIPFIGTLNDVHVLDDACRGADIVLHLAAALGETKAMTGELVRVNVEGTHRLLESCKKNDVKQILFTSTVDVYGRKRKGTLNEESSLIPTDKYGYSKMLAEHEIMRSGVPYTIFRIATIYGPGFEHSFFKMFRVIHEGRTAIIGSGQNHLTMVHVDDVINAIMLAVENPEISIGKIYNVADNTPFTQEELIDLAAKMMNVNKPKKHVSEFLVRMIARQRNLDSDELRFITSDRMIDTSKIEKELKFRTKVEIKDGGKEMVDAFLIRMKK